MEEMVKQTIPVVIEDPLHGDIFVILFAREEGSEFEVLVCRNEYEADRYMKEYERSGTLSYPNSIIRSMNVSSPVVMLKTKTIRSVRKEFRVVTMPDPNVIDSE